MRTTTATCLLLATLALPAAAEHHEANPPADGFDAAGSDARAIEIADAVMAKMGGREAWDATRYVTWKFFGRRLHVWDKWTGDIRVEGTDRESGEPYTVLMNLESGEGRAFTAGEEVTDPEALAKMLDGAEAAWINDGYWVFMPYKLKDSGVTLKHQGEAAMLDGRPADVLRLTFEGVGRTPQNAYRVYVARDTGLVEQWDFFADAGDTEPRFQMPWHDWEPHGGILLSADRGEVAHTGIAVYDELPRSVFDSPAAIDWEALGR